MVIQIKVKSGFILAIAVGIENESPRRCGGQGDLLAGCLSTFLCWFRHQNNQESNSYLLSCVAACLLMKESSKSAYSSHRRSMISEDILNEIGNAFQKLFEK